MDASALVPASARLVGFFEGRKLVAYPDPVSPLRRWLDGAHGRTLASPDRPPSLSGAPWTNGYGDTGPDVVEGVVWTKEQAAYRLGHRLLTEYCPAVLLAVPDGALPVEALAAVASLAYNIGADKLITFHHLAGALRTGDPKVIAAELHVFNHAGGVIVGDLTKRRGQEANHLLGWCGLATDPDFNDPFPPGSPVAV